MSSQNQSESHQNLDIRLYDCGIPTCLTTSWTPTNQGRRFLHFTKSGVYMSFSIGVHDFFETMELLNGFDIIKAVDTQIAEEDDIIGEEGGKLQGKGEAVVAASGICCRVFRNYFNSTS
ncbi:hypothetical protein RHGRI_016501 [Rhododendron griersonianum]|uniref:Uncharacterized protein n=1 Tax=Rhododendron griersonianum TaxID=479676 RepID=A0AAV6JUE0_9ERIC|nr:hypothetical protein RHGRI_016501 [Rhododendron griersonianum]